MNIPNTIYEAREEHDKLKRQAKEAITYLLWRIRGRKGPIDKNNQYYDGEK